MRIVPFVFLLALAGCAAVWPGSVPRSTPNHAVLKLTFQEGQTVTIQLNTTPQLQAAVLGWVSTGVYKATPVYRNRPGVFLLTGKPRLAGQPFVAGALPPLQQEESLFSTATVGLVRHVDGTVGPELALRYGLCPELSCDAPESVTIGHIVQGRDVLETVQRGDTLTEMTLNP